MKYLGTQKRALHTDFYCKVMGSSVLVIKQALSWLSISEFRLFLEKLYIFKYFERNFKKKINEIPEPSKRHSKNGRFFQFISNAQILGINLISHLHGRLNFHRDHHHNHHRLRQHDHRHNEQDYHQFHRKQHAIGRSIPRQHQGLS